MHWILTPYRPKNKPLPGSLHGLQRTASPKWVELGLFSHSIDGTGKFTYIFHKNQVNVGIGKYTIHAIHALFGFGELDDSFQKALRFKSKIMQHVNFRNPQADSFIQFRVFLDSGKIIIEKGFPVVVWIEKSGQSTVFNHNKYLQTPYTKCFKYLSVCNCAMYFD